MTQDTPYHIPALLPQTLEALHVQPGGVYIDCTYGGGGHSRAIMELLSADAGGHLYGLDRDTDAVQRAPQDHPCFTMVHANFRHIANFARYYGVDGHVDGVLADLGVSFHHFDDADRGFSFRSPDAPLDMRMNRSAGPTAADLLNTADPERLATVFKLYGEFNRARQMAAAIATARAKEPIATAGQLMQVMRPFISPRQEKKDLARLFQALRIEVNDEIGALRQMLQGALQVLRPGGRLAIITYHSLEDRIVKNFMRTGNVEGKEEKDFFGRSTSPIKPLYNKPIAPDEAEIAANPRSRSAKLRVAVKLPANQDE